MTDPTPAKSPARVVRFEELEWSPRFEYGHMADLTSITSGADGTELGTGFGRLKNARIPWTISYDEVLIVIEGSMTLHVNGEPHELGRLDSIWLPAGSELIYEGESALIAFAIHPQFVPPAED